MAPAVKTFIAVVIAVVVTFVGTTILYRQHAIKTAIQLMTAKVDEMNAYNDVGRVEAYDRVESLLRKGCTKEALDLIKVEQTLLLSGLAYQMAGNEAVKGVVMARNANVGGRAVLGPGKHVIPTC